MPRYFVNIDELGQLKKAQHFYEKMLGFCRAKWVCFIPGFYWR